MRLVHRAELGEGAVLVKRSLVAYADVTLERWCSGERTAEFAARVWKARAAAEAQGAEVDRCTVYPVEGPLSDEAAVIPGGSEFDGEAAEEAGGAGRFPPTHPGVAAVERGVVKCGHENLGVIPVLLVHRPVPLQSLPEPARLPANFVVNDGIG